MSKRRSGFANHRRAYHYNCCSASSPIISNGLIVGNQYIESTDILYWSSLSENPQVVSSGDYSDVRLFRITGSGVIIGGGYNSNTLLYLYWPSFSSNPLPLPTGGYTDIQIINNYLSCINSSGVIISFGKIDNDIFPLYWSSPSSDPEIIEDGIYIDIDPSAINEYGEFVGTGNDDNNKYVLYWPLFSASPLPGSTIPINITNLKLQSFNKGGEIVGTGFSSGVLVCFYWSSYTAIVQSLSLAGIPTLISLQLFITDSSIIIGSGIDEDDKPINIYWSTPIADPEPLDEGTFTNLIILNVNQKTGVIVGSANAGPNDNPAIYWSSYSAEPKNLPYGIYTNLGAETINENDQVVGIGQGIKINSLIWPSSTTNPFRLSSGNLSNTLPFNISNSNVIVGGCNIQTINNDLPIYWPSPSSNPNFLKSGIYNNVVATGIANKTVVGNGYDSDFNSLAFYWPSLTENPIPLNSGVYKMINSKDVLTSKNLDFKRFSTTLASYNVSTTLASYNLSFNIYFNLSINSSGVIVGSGLNVDNDKFVPLYWSSYLAPNPLPLSTIFPENNDYEVFASHINTKGEVVGYYNDGENEFPLYWSSIYSNPVPMKTEQYTNVTAKSINDVGVIVGFNQVGAYGGYPLYWSSYLDFPNPLPTVGYQDLEIN